MLLNYFCILKISLKLALGGSNGNLNVKIMESSNTINYTKSSNTYKKKHHVIITK